MSKTKEARKHRAWRRRNATKNWCYVYAVKERDGEPFRYVGQTRSLAEERLTNHYREIRRRQYAGQKLTPFQAWLDGLDQHPIVEVIDREGIWDISEAVWIDRLRRDGHPLLNVLSVVK